MDSKTQYRQFDSLLRRIANSRAVTRLQTELKNDCRKRPNDFAGRKQHAQTVARWAACLGD